MSNERPLVVATWNIHAAVGTDGRFAPERIVAVLSEMNADVVALQEVEHHDIDGRDLLVYLAEEGRYESIAGPTLLRGDRHYGNALLTRLPVEDVARVDLSLPGCEPRGALDVKIRAGDEPLRVLTTHLGLRPRERRHQVRQLLDQLDRRHEEQTTVLMGDFNEWLGWGRPLRSLQSRFAATRAVPTCPSRFPLFALDRIYVHPDVALRYVCVHNSALARQASDHLPVTAQLIQCRPMSRE
jgi:endonuclease/exonuclease/phosphatase family metal-dependent hydrolase